MRYYLPGIGRFLSRVHLEEAIASGATSPAELRQRWGIDVRRGSPEQPYAYCDNDPSNWVDPGGLQRLSLGPKLPPRRQRYHDACAIEKCLSPIAGTYPCAQGSGCGKAPAAGVDTALAICMMWNESCFLDQFSPKECGTDSGGGLGQVGSGEMTDLHNACCDEGGYGKGGARRVHGRYWCEGAKAAFRWLQCRGLWKYGGDYRKNGGVLSRQVEACAKCVRQRGCANFDQCRKDAGLHG